MNFILILIFYTVSAQAESPKHRSVNLALETVLEFNNKHDNGDVKIIDKIRGFLDRLKTMITNNEDSRRNLQIEHMKFTDFIKNAIAIISGYEDEDIEDTVAVLNDEIRRYHYKGCKFYELIENSNVRRFIAKKLDNINDIPGNVLRDKLSDISIVFDDDSMNEKQNNMLDFINSLYGKESTPKLKNFLEHLKLYKSKSKRANLDLIRIIRDGLRSVLFDHYTNLNRNVKRELIVRLDLFWKDYSNARAHNMWNAKPVIKFGYNNANENAKNKQDELSKTSSKIKIKDTKGLKNNQASIVTNKKRKYHYISLYPETITKTEKQKLFKKKTTSITKIYTYFKNKKKKHKNEVKFKAPKLVKDIVEEFDAVVDVKSARKEREKYLDTDSNKRTTFIDIWKYKLDRKPKTHKSANSKQSNKIRFRATTPSSEGISIEVTNRYKEKSFRKSNDNITDDNITLDNAKTKTPIPNNYVRRIEELEKKLNAVKKQILDKNINDLITTKNNTSLEYWVSTTETHNKDAIVTKNLATDKSTNTDTTDSIKMTENTTILRNNEIGNVIAANNTNEDKSSPVLRSNLNLKSDFGSNEIKIDNVKVSTKDSVAITKNETATITSSKDLGKTNLNESFEENKLYDVDKILETGVGDDGINSNLTPFNFDYNKMFNDSKALDFEDPAKKRLVQELIKKDFSRMFSKTTPVGVGNFTNVSLMFTDPFEDLDRDIDI